MATKDTDNQRNDTSMRESSRQTDQEIWMIDCGPGSKDVHDWFWYDHQSIRCHHHRMNEFLCVTRTVQPNSTVCELYTFGTRATTDNSHHQENREESVILNAHTSKNDTSAEYFPVASHPTKNIHSIGPRVRPLVSQPHGTRDFGLGK